MARFLAEHVTLRGGSLGRDYKTRLIMVGAML